MCSTIESTVIIDLKRCPCIHSLSQLVDVTLQSLLYQRQMIPEPVSTLLRGSTPVAEQFKRTYPKVQQILRNTFRSANGDGRIREFLMLVDCAGGAAAGSANATDFETNYCCCEAPTYCEELSAKERRLIFSAVALSKTAVAYFEGCKVPGRMEKVFMFIRTKGQLVDSGAGNGEGGLEEDESFEVPDGKMRRRRNIRQLRIQVNAPCSQRLRPRRTPTTVEGPKNGTAAAEENDENVEKRIDANDEAAVNGWRRRAYYGKEYKELEAYNNDYNTADDNDAAADADEDVDEDNDEEEMVCSTWYRLGPFLTNLC
uniref:Uncharacterized protein n=1 Tax=Globodera rostochiensis TaxID=31243 RepID=A0A914I8Z3_GLORO